MAIERVRVALVGLAALGAAACAGILGIEDRALDPAGGDASSGDDGADTCGDPCTMATGLNHPFLMTADGANVYWTEFGDALFAENGSVKSCPVTGCGAGPLVYAVLQVNPRGIAVDPQNVYWGTSTVTDQNGAIWSCPIGGCNGKPTKVVDANAPFGLALDGTYVYWTDNFDNTVHRAPKAGGADSVLSDAGSSTASLSNGQGCAVLGANVYVSDESYDLFRLPVGGGDLQPVYAQDAGWLGPAPIAVDPGGVYFGTPGQILRFDKTGTGPGTAIASTVAGPSSLQIDSTGTLYWSDWGSGTGKDGTVGRVPLDGGQPTVLQQSLEAAEAVAVNDRYVFWLSNGTISAGSSSGGTVAGTGSLHRTKK